MNQQQLKSVDKFKFNEPEEAGIRGVTVVLWPDSDSVSTMSYALRFARKYGSSLTALYVKPYPDVPMAHYGTIPQQYIDLLADIADKQAAECQNWFTQQVSDAGIKFKWKEHTGAVGMVADPGLPAADLIIAGQPLHENSGRQQGIINTLILQSGRPAVVVPAAGYAGAIADRVMLAWNGSQQSTRAVHDALPILRKANNSVRAVVVPRGNGRSEVDRAVAQAATLGEHLERHGIAVEPLVPDPAGAEEAQVIRSLANAGQTDLLVTGAWGHSRVREYTLGGVTRSLLEGCEVPVLFSH